MDKKMKVFAIAFALMAFVAVSTAMTYTNKATALADLGKATPQNFEAGTCMIHQVTESINFGEQDGKIVVEYSFHYKIDGEERDEYDGFTAPTADAKDIENLVAAKCDAKWAGVKDQADNKKIESVHIDYTQGNLKSLLDKTYDVVSKTWS